MDGFTQGQARSEAGQLRGGPAGYPTQQARDAPIEVTASGLLVDIHQYLGDVENTLRQMDVKLTGGSPEKDPEFPATNFLVVLDAARYRLQRIVTLACNINAKI